MISAIEAKSKTEKQITEVAKKFIIDELAEAIDEACDKGQFRTCRDVPLTLSGDTKRLGKVVEQLLKENGYNAEFTYCDDGPRVECRVTIDWSSAQ